MRWGLSFKLFLLTFLPVLVAVGSFSYFYYHLIRASGLKAILIWWMVCICILLWSFWMSRRYFLKPVLNLKEAVRNIMLGNLDTKIAISNRDELGELALNFNKMMDDLKTTTVSRNFLDHLLQSLPEAVIFFDEDRKIQVFNQKAEELFGFSFSEILGREVSVLFSANNQGLFKEYLDAFTQQDSPAFLKLDMALMGIKQNREEFPAKIALSKTVLHGKPIQGMILRDFTWEKEAQIRERKLVEETLESTGRELEKLAQLEKAQKAYLNIIEDLDSRRKEMEQREIELREAQAQLVQSAKLAMVGQLASGVAHEINNPLQAIATNLEVAGMVLQDKSPSAQTELPEILEDTKRATQRCKEIVQGILRFAKPSVARFEQVSLPDPIAEALSLTQNQLKQERIQVEKEIPADLPRIKGNTRELMQVFVNLILNATRAMSESPIKKLTITVKLQGKKILVSFQDTGHGISSESLPHIFEPFFTTSYEEGSSKMKGTGLGLTICQRIIEEHHGRIEAKSDSLQGATFNIILPARDS